MDLLLQTLRNHLEHFCLLNKRDPVFHPQHSVGERLCAPTAKELVLLGQLLYPRMNNSETLANKQT